MWIPWCVDQLVAFLLLGGDFSFGSRDWVSLIPVVARPFLVFCALISCRFEPGAHPLDRDLWVL